MFVFVDQKGLLKFDYLLKTFCNVQKIVVLETTANPDKRFTDKITKMPNFI